MVPGNILALEKGDNVPADARLIEVVELKTNEAVLTGESTPEQRVDGLTRGYACFREAKNGFLCHPCGLRRGKAVVVAAGMNTELGKIAEMVQTAEEEETPLQKLDRFTSKIAKVVIAVGLLIFALEAFEVAMKMHFEIEGFIQAIMSSISLVISAVPEAFENKFFVIADLASVALTIGITYIPITQQVFRLTSLSLTELAYVIGVASWGSIFPEIFMGRKVWKWE